MLFPHGEKITPQQRCLPRRGGTVRPGKAFTPTGLTFHRRDANDTIHSSASRRKEPWPGSAHRADRLQVVALSDSKFGSVRKGGSEDDAEGLRAHGLPNLAGGRDRVVDIPGQR